MEDFGKEGLRVVFAAERLIEELVMILEEVGPELPTGAGEGVKVVEVKVMRERFDNTEQATTGQRSYKQRRRLGAGAGHAGID